MVIWPYANMLCALAAAAITTCAAVLLRWSRERFASAAAGRAINQQPAGERERQREREREEVNADCLAASLTTVNWHGASQSSMPGKADVIASASLPPAEAKPARTTPSFLFPRDREKRHGTFPGQLWFHHGHSTDGFQTLGFHLMGRYQYWFITRFRLNVDANCQILHSDHFVWHWTSLDLVTPESSDHHLILYGTVTTGLFRRGPSVSVDWYGRVRGRNAQWRRC